MAGAVFVKKEFFGYATPAIKKEAPKRKSAVRCAFSKVLFFGERTPYSTFALRGPKVAGRRCVFKSRISIGIKKILL